MNHTIVLLERDGYLLLFCWVFAEQAGLPLPSVPALIAAGVLAGFGHLNWAIAIAVAVTAAVCGDSIWFALGRTHGESVTRFLKWLAPSRGFAESLSPRRGSRLLLVTKFVPGMSFLTPPLSGVSGMSTSRFLFFDVLGAGIWVGTFVTAGRVCGTQFSLVLVFAPHVVPVLVVLAGMLAAIAVAEYFRGQATRTFVKRPHLQAIPLAVREDCSARPRRVTPS
jgi:membrane protein DedA with SNARE-associated domain